MRNDLAPWFVAGVIAAALLFAWNQFVSLLGGLATGVALSQVQGANLDAPEVMQGVILGNLAISLPLSAVAAVFAGIQLNRYARSHVFAALALASVCFLVFNLSLNYFAQPEYIVEQITIAVSGGALSMLQFFGGMALVGFVIFVFGIVGILISHFNRERSIGRLIDAARRFTPASARRWRRTSQAGLRLRRAHMRRRKRPARPSLRISAFGRGSVIRPCGRLYGRRRRCALCGNLDVAVDCEARALIVP